MEDKQLTPAQAIKKFFFADSTAKEFMDEYKLLTTDDKEQLSFGIIDGSLTY